MFSVNLTKQVVADIPPRRVEQGILFFISIAFFD